MATNSLSHSTKEILNKLHRKRLADHLPTTKDPFVPWWTSCICRFLYSYQVFLVIIKCCINSSIQSCSKILFLEWTHGKLQELYLFVHWTSDSVQSPSSTGHTLFWLATEHRGVHSLHLCTSSVWNEFLTKERQWILLTGSFKQNSWGQQRWRQKVHKTIWTKAGICAVLLLNETPTAPFLRRLQNAVNFMRSNVSLVIE